MYTCKTVLQNYNLYITEHICSVSARAPITFLSLICSFAGGTCHFEAFVCNCCCACPFLIICLHQIAGGVGVFAGRAFKKDEVVTPSWMTLFLPIDFSKALSLWHYVFGNNETHVLLPLGYGTIAKHHESANAKNVWADSSHQNIEVAVRRLFFEH